MEFVNFVEVVLDDDEDEGTEASELFFFRYWYDICTSSREKQEFLSGEKQL